METMNEKKKLDKNKTEKATENLHGQTLLTNLEKQLLVNRRRSAAKALLKAARKDSLTAVHFERTR